MRSILFVTLIAVSVLQSCRLRPFVKYYHVSKKTHFPHFNKQDKYLGSDTNIFRRSIDITCYDWSVSVNPEKEQIKALMKLGFTMTSPQKKVMLDFERHMKMDSVKSNVPLKDYRRKKDVVYFEFERELSKGERVVLDIYYHGRPVKILTFSTINWKKDKQERPWVCTLTQGIGPQHMIPCKMLLNDEPDSCFIRVGVPKDLIAVANGKLDGITETPTENIYNWAVRNPINIYNISFNVGHYVKLEKAYTDINNVARKIEVYALDYNKTIADTFYDQAPLIMRHFENTFGAFPWWNDGCKFIEANSNGTAMEHQSGIAMFRSYYYDFNKMNTTLAHELGHEWWGNNITGYDYADLWLHEGFATYCEFLAAEGLYGSPNYSLFARYYAQKPANKRPVLKRYNVAYNSMVSNADQDIYPKGAMLLHTLRRQLDNDPLFFSILKKAQKEFAGSNITTAQFIQFFNAEAGRDFSPFFDVYLNEIQPPILEYTLTPIDSSFSTMSYKWKNELPENFNMKVSVDVKDNSLVIFPTNSIQEIKVPANQPVYFDRGKFGYILTENKTPGKKR